MAIINKRRSLVAHPGAHDIQLDLKSVVARDGIELQGGIDNTQVVDFAFCQKG